ncbi:MAG: ribosome-associated translation inhibitor RaiA [Bdellovibrionota bacterium]
MVLNISFKHMKTSDHIKDYTEKKSEKLKKYFKGKIHVTWSFSVEKDTMIAHCHLLGNHMDYFGEAMTEDMEISIDRAVEKIEKQVRKHKEIVKDHLHKNARRTPDVD